VADGVKRLAAGIATALSALLAAADARAAESSQYPSRPIRLIVPGPAGGAPDLNARIVQPMLGELLGQPIVVDNRPGAGGMIGTELAARAVPDGYTLLWGGPGSLTIQPHLHKRLTFDPAKDFVPVSLVAMSPMLLLVNPSIPARSVAELVSLARSQPDKLNYASFGVGNVNHLAMEQLKGMSGAKLTHVSYNGSPPALNALLGGYVQVLFASPPSTIDHVRAGRLRALGVSSMKRLPLAPEIPTLSESGLADFQSGAWSALLAPAKTPGGIVAVLSTAVVKTVGSPKVRAQLEGQGTEPVGSSPADFAAFMRAESDKHAKIVKAAGIKVD